MWATLRWQSEVNILFRHILNIVLDSSAHMEHGSKKPAFHFHSVKHKSFIADCYLMKTIWSCTLLMKCILAIGESSKIHPGLEPWSSK